MPDLYLVALDRDRLGDALFLQSLAQHIQQAMPGAPACLFVHGSGEKVERTLEAEGIFVERVDGVLEVDTPAQKQLVERAVREMNQSIVGTLTDEVVPAVGIQGVDRGLLQSADDGTLTTGRLGWLEALIKQHVIPVVSALAPEDESRFAREVPMADAVLALADGLSGAFACHPTVFTSTGRAGLTDATGTPKEASVEAVPTDTVPAYGLVQRAVGGGLTPLVTSPKGLFGNDGPTGTRIQPQPTASE